MTGFPSLAKGGRPLVLPLAALVFVVVALYRFNALGGAMAGFDNDHFLHFVYAKQVQAGAQPLRDFLDAGLQGARPSLTYELSAAAQRYFGENLRSEAWLTVSGVALGAAVAFVAGSQLAPWPWALVTTLLSALLSPKLYSYPKVLLLAVASLLIAHYAAAPTWRRVGLMAVCTAIAFLFRHDYAVYCAVGFVAAIGLDHAGTWRGSARRAAGYVLGTVVLLGPSLWWIQRYTGLVEYMRNGFEMSRREAVRTDLTWPVPDLARADSVSALLVREANTQAWLYYVFVAVPIVAVAIAGSRRARGQPDPGGRDASLVALGLMTLTLSLLFLRGSLEARFGDMAPPVAVIGAALLVASTKPSRDRVTRHARAVAAIAVVTVTAACIWQLQSVRTELLRAGFLTSPLAVARQAARISSELLTAPAAMRDSPDASFSMQAARYLHDCTRPTDRVLVVAFAPETLAFADRRFAGGRATFVPGFYMDERYSLDAVVRLDGESVPIALAEPEPYYAAFPLLAEYLRSRYEETGTIAVDGGRPLRVLVHRARAGRPFGHAGWPCFG